jgi:hypothetical protein
LLGSCGGFEDVRPLLRLGHQSRRSPPPNDEVHSRPTNRGDEAEPPASSINR